MNGDVYLWIKALHIMAVLAWMAGMFYLPRLYVYHAGVAADGPEAAQFKVMERKLLRFIMNPSLAVVWITGLVLFMSWTTAGWMHAKLLLVVGMTLIHGLLARWRKQLEAGTCSRDGKFFRMINEAPTLLMVGIVILVVVKPF